MYENEVILFREKQTYRNYYYYLFLFLKRFSMTKISSYFPQKTLLCIMIRIISDLIEKLVFPVTPSCIPSKKNKQYHVNEVQFLRMHAWYVLTQQPGRLPGGVCRHLQGGPDQETARPAGASHVAAPQG